jgi:hypothetical protein
VSLRVSSTMPPGALLSYSSGDGDSGFGGGYRLPAEPHTWTLPLAPGTVTLGCNPPQQGPMPVLGPSTEIEVTDPEGYWRGDDLAAAGCPGGGGIPGWKRGLQGTGDTSAEALEATLDGFREMNDDLTLEQASAYYARPANTGYVGAPTQTWVMLKNNEPYATILVTNTGDGFESGPDALCGR